MEGNRGEPGLGSVAEVWTELWVSAPTGQPGCCLLCHLRLGARDLPFGSLLEQGSTLLLQGYDLDRSNRGFNRRLPR